MSLYKVLHHFYFKKKKINLILSGGLSPLKQYSLLSQVNINWKKINVYLTDDRNVNETSKFSNYRNVKNCFNKLKSSLNFVKLNIYSSSIFNKQKISLLNNLKLNSTLTILSMGDDGHFASIFYNLKKFKELIDPLSKPNLYLVEKTGNPKFSRLTMNLSMILKSDLIIINVLNLKKKKLLYKLLAKEDKKYPISALLKYAKTKILVYDGNHITNLKS